MSYIIKGLQFIIFIFIIGGCGQQMDMEKVKEELLKADRDFSNLSLEKGSVEAFYSYMADVSESTDIGYTHGKYELKTTDSTGAKNTTYGYYITVWKKQADGSWKFVFDTGNELPKQVK
ncbi:hypothetical protein KA005_42070 [bacterium]|nr:hypothetical protein [bacterium]